MKKYIIPAIVILIVIIGLLLFFLTNKTLEVDPKDQTCQSDDDCIMAMVKCSCDCGVPINNIHWDKYLDRQAQMCRSYDGKMCKILCDQELRCINNVCQIVEESPVFSPPPDSIVCSKDSDCDWVSGWPEEYGGCGCFNKEYINHINEYGDLSLQPIRECEPPPNQEQPCICLGNECKLNLQPTP